LPQFSKFTNPVYGPHNFVVVSYPRKEQVVFIPIRPAMGLAGNSNCGSLGTHGKVFVFPLPCFRVVRWSTKNNFPRRCFHDRVAVVSSRQFDTKWSESDFLPTPAVYSVKQIPRHFHC
jgi:hypothetical protein